MLTFTIKPDESPRIDARGLTPGGFESLEELRRLPLSVGNRKSEVSEVFDIEGDIEACEWRFEGDLSRVHHLGEGMQQGTLTVAGGVGRHCGSRMTDGTITVEGDAGDWLGAEMRGGRIVVHGDSGDNVGGAYRGSKLGMRGGEVTIHGSAGAEVGQSMRRGLVLVAGDCGPLAGYRMRAGTILVLGNCGSHPGLEMLRGTIGLFGKDRNKLPPTFRRACRAEPQVVRLLRKHAAGLVGEEVAQAIPLEVDLHNGDLLRGGRGEVFLP